MWAALLLAMEAEQTGPDDDFDDETNGLPSSTLGEDDEGGFDEMADWPDETPDSDGGDDGFEDAGESADDEDEDEDGLEGELSGEEEGEE